MVIINSLTIYVYNINLKNKEYLKETNKLRNEKCSFIKSMQRQKQMLNPSKSKHEKNRTKKKRRKKKTATTGKLKDAKLKDLRKHERER